MRRFSVNLYALEMYLSLSISEQLACGLRKLLPILGEIQPSHSEQDLCSAHGMSLLCGQRAEATQAYRVQLTAYALRMLSAQSVLLKEFASSGVRALALKGLSLSVMLYGEIGMREFGDLDIWVSPSDAERAFACLQSLGYAKSRPLGLSASQELAHLRYGKAQTWFCSRTGVQVDLHWRLLSNWIDDELIGFDSAWESRLQLGGDGLPLWPTLGEEETVVFLALHGAQDGWTCLKQVLDMVQALQVLDFDWQRVDRIAGRRWPLMEKSIELCLKLVDMESIGLGTRHYRDRNEALAHWRQLLTAANTPQRRLLRPELWRCGRPEQIIRSARAVLTPAIDDIEAFDLPRFLIGLYPVLRAARLVWKTLHRSITRQTLDPP